MHDKSQRVIPLFLRHVSVEIPQARSVVRYGADAAPFASSAVAGEVDVAGLGRRVLGVDVVEGCAETAGGGVFVAVGPGGDVGEVGGGGVVEEGLAECCGGGVQEGGGEVGDCLVA